MNTLNQPPNESPSPAAPAHSRFKDWLMFSLEIARMLLIALAINFSVRVIIIPVRVLNVSMVPTLQEREILFVNKLAYKFGSIQRGDILTFHYPLNPELDYIKRAIGLPGDVVEVKDDKVWINSILLIEPYLVVKPEYEDNHWEVPPDAIFVMGDNRNDSVDSRAWGFVPLKDVIGKALVVYWPVTRFRILTHPDIFSTQ
jgi:signal peptidase I